MRKLIILLFLLIFVSTTLLGCSSNQTPALKKTEEQIRAEVKAEMETEQKLKGESKKADKANEEMEAEPKSKEENKTDAKAIEESKVDNKAEEDKTDNLKTYDEVYKDSGLKGAIDYFDAHYDQFSEEKRKSFADKVSFEVNNRGNVYAVINDSIPEAPTPAPKTIENVDWFYPNIYSSKNNTFNLSYVEDPGIKKAINNVKNDDIFILTKAYWISDGNIEDSNFRVVMHPDIYRKVERCLKITYVKQEYGEYATKSGERVNGLEGFFKPAELLKAGDSKWKSDEKYPKVYVEALDKIELMRDAWKTEAYLPVKIIDEKSSADSMSNK